MTIYNRESYIQQGSPIKRLLLRLFDENDSIKILDIGGCEGEESLRYSKLFPNSYIYIFEPLPLNLIRIKSNLENYNAKNIRIMPYAVSNSDGHAAFHVSTGHPKHINQNIDWDFGNKSSSLLLPIKDNNPKWLEFTTEIEVDTITLDTFFKHYNIKEVDFVHMDVQGAELQVLEGSIKSLKNIKAIWLEVADIELYKGQPLRFDIEGYMFTNNFVMIYSKMEGAVGDQFYINKKYYKYYSLFSKSIILKR